MNQPTSFNGFSEPTENYFRLPNDWFEIVQRVREVYGSRIVALLKMLEYILRHTWGYRRFDGSVRLTAAEIHSGRKFKGRRIDQGTALAENSVHKAGEALREMGLIEIDTDDSDKARRVRAYRPHIRSEEEMTDETQPFESFDGFDNPHENYFKVPSVWTDITRGISSASTILTVEYFFRHSWGYNNPDGTWMDPDDICNGRKYATSPRRYDNGTGYDLSTIYRALNEAVELGILVWAEQWEHETVRRVYNLRLKGMPVGPDGCFQGRLPWDDNVPDNPMPIGFCTVEDGICNLEELSGKVEALPVGDLEDLPGGVEEPIRKVEAVSGVIEVSPGVDEARTASPHTLTDTITHLNPTPSSDTAPAKSSSQTTKFPISVDDGGKQMLPKELLSQLQVLGWEGDTVEVQRAYAQDMQRVAAWLVHILGKKHGMNNPAGLFRARLRDGSFPPGFHRSTSPDPTEALAVRREQARKKIAEARKRQSQPRDLQKGTSL